jgi:hypothetical protein
MQRPSPASWTQWSLRDWNEALLLHYFGGDGSIDTPVTRLVVTPTELRRATGEAQGDPRMVEEAFLGILRQPRERFNQAVSARTWLNHDRWTSTDPPGFLAYLILTCLVASTIAEGIVHENNFRDRLAFLLGNEMDESYPLTDLPALWLALQEWLRERRAEGEPYRRLILTKPPSSRRLIGYSLLLAFPSRRDELILADILQNRALGENPPVTDVLRLVQKNADRFSDVFRGAFENFRASFHQGNTGLFDDPFWTAVRAAAVAELERASALSVPLQLVLQPGQDSSAELFLVSAVPPGTNLGHVTFCETQATLGEYQSIAWVDLRTGDDGFRWAVTLLLNGVFNTALPKRAGPSSLAQIVREGVLLFVSDEWGVRQLTPSRPVDGTVHALVRDDLVSGFVSMMPRDRRPRHFRSTFDHWSETTPFEAEVLTCFDRVSRGPFSEVKCLQPTITPPKISLSGGVRIEGGFLGLPCCLPTVTAAGADSVTLYLVEKTSGREERTEWASLAADGRVTSKFTFPETVQELLDGVFLLIARAGQDVLARRQVSFRGSLIVGEYKSFANPADWLVESTGPAVVDASEAEPEIEAPSAPDSVSTARMFNWRVAPEISEVRRREVRLVPSAFGTTPDPRFHTTTHDDDQRHMQFVECCAGLAANRKGIEESEFLERLQTTFGIGETALVWDVVRAWSESGSFDRAVYRPWRGRRYFARAPRFVLSREGGEVHATLCGLATWSTRDRIRASAHTHGARARSTQSYSAWIPAPVRWSADSPEAFHRITQEAMLSPSLWVRPLSEFVFPVAQVLSDGDTEPFNYATYGWWNWDRETFGQGESRPNSEIEVEWLRRSDRNDRFVVRRNGESVWSTVSRNWAILAAYTLAGRAPFARAGRNSLVRSVHGQVYLPLPAARALSARSDTAAGPCFSPEGNRGYGYSFRSGSVRESMLDLLWGLIGRPLPPHDVRWLLALARRRDFAPGQPRVPIPAALRNLLPVGSADFGVGELERMRVPASLLPHVDRLLRRNER